MGAENIKIRFLAETHADIVRALYYAVLIRKCTRPREGTSHQRLVKRVKDTVHPLAMKYGTGFTERSAEILINTAANLEFLHKDYHWGAKGHVINVFGTVYEAPNLPEKIAYNLPEKIAYLKYFLEGDGGALIQLVRTVSELGGIERGSFLTNRGWEKMVENMAKEYLSYPLDLDQKYRLKKILGDKSRPKTALGGYSERTTPHRLIPRAEILVDLGIIERRDEPEVRYEPANIDGHDTTNKFTQLFGDIPSIEKALSRKGDFFDRAARLYGLDYPRVDARKDFPIISFEIVRAYKAVRDSDFRLAQIEAVGDIVSLRMLYERKRVCERNDVDAALERMKEQAGKDIHYHVDDWGVISYITLNQGYVDRMISSRA